MKVGDKLRPVRRGFVPRMAVNRTGVTAPVKIDENSRALVLQAPKDATGGIKILLLDNMQEYVSLCDRWEVLPNDQY